MRASKVQVMKPHKTFREPGINTYSMVRYPLHLLEVLCLGQQAQSLGIELATGRVEGLAVLFAQLGAKGVKRDDKSTSVCLKLNLQDIKSVKLNHLLDALDKFISKMICFPFLIYV